jgi:hypothetical protein
MVVFGPQEDGKKGLVRAGPESAGYASILPAGNVLGQGGICKITLYFAWIYVSFMAACEDRSMESEEGAQPGY